MCVLVFVCGWCVRFSVVQDSSFKLSKFQEGENHFWESLFALGPKVFQKSDSSLKLQH